jgi:hypothetical protein
MSGRRGSNPRPRPWQGRALPAELFSRFVLNRFKEHCNSHYFLIASANIEHILYPANAFCKKIKSFLQPFEN